jgi:CRP/FNR family transcriptional regulator, anaerobic regulatory protein
MKALCEQSSVKMVAPTTPLVQKGDVVGGVLLIVHGSVRVFYNEEGRQGTLYRVTQGQACFLSIECAMRGSPYPAWAESEQTPTQFVRIPDRVYLTLYSEEPSFQRFTYETLSSRLLEMMAVVQRSATLAVGQRTAALLLDLADEAGQVVGSQEELAHHLGTAREVLARTLRSFRTQGLIQTRRGALTILDSERLSELLGRRRFF